MKNPRISFDAFINGIQSKEGQLSLLSTDTSAGFEAEKFPCCRRDGKIYIFDEQYSCHVCLAERAILNIEYSQTATEWKYIVNMQFSTLIITGKM